VLYLGDDGEEVLAGIFGTVVSAEGVLDTVVANTEPGDWVIDAEGKPMIIAEARTADD
jgi:hypothetical protein